ncbi:hypothetical protein ACU635_32340 [[Actinomadura] parvosata]|uniref:hypothetical protein n=1 Tax=[Actinomadura] parvosata TaxID=1955412 RepID=UPI00406CB538
MNKVLKRSLTTAAVVLVLGGAAASPFLAESVEHERVCGSLFGSVDAALESFDVLGAAPAGAVAQGGRERSCTDTDDHHASVGRSYRLASGQGSPGQVESFYHDLAVRHGWRPIPGGGDDGCVVKEAGGAEVSLNVRFDPEAAGVYAVSASTWPC